eukprot:m.275779 g.275779  ORF g.275779 m.275779 type:complete len:533 (-) comp26910_c0_seq3:255-1853(-)
MLLVGLLGVVVGTPAGSVPPTTIMSIFIDDLGFYDTAVYNDAAPTPHLAELSHSEGMILARHYTYKYCSPTRRSFLSGRFPVHMTGMQAPICTNWLPLDYSLLSHKLKSHGTTIWKNHFVGKGHLGYQTMDHLPVNRGFDSHVGYLMGAEEYVHGYNFYGAPNHDCPGTPALCYKDFWMGKAPASSAVIDEVFYSTNYYTTRVLEILKNHTVGDSLWVHLMYQGVHAPYVEPPQWEQIPTTSTFWDQTFGSMLQVVDRGINNITTNLKASGRWETTLILVSSDNGGIGPGNNYPLRGMKATPWEGGIRVTAFLTGGYLPPALRGSVSRAFVSIADWYPTFCTLAGVADCNDLIHRGNQTFPIDGVDQWPRLTGATTVIGHEYLPTTEEGIIWKEQYKLLTNAQPTNWYAPNDTHYPDNRTAWPCRNSSAASSTVIDSDGVCNLCNYAHPCLFDLTTDEDERHNIAEVNPAIVKDLMAKLADFNVPQANSSIDPMVLARDYDCVTDIRLWWGNFTGPCCKRKGKTKATLQTTY